jgi:hypothetical protein
MQVDSWIDMQDALHKKIKRRWGAGFIDAFSHLV